MALRCGASASNAAGSYYCETSILSSWAERGKPCRRARAAATGGVFAANVSKSWTPKGRERNKKGVIPMKDRLDYSWILEDYPSNVPVAVAAEIMGKPVSFVQYGLENGTLRFGCCSKNKINAFHISPAAFVRYMEGRDDLDIRGLLDALAEETAKKAAKEAVKMALEALK